jgi:polyhydroxybutyrate depolymerase
MKSIVFLISLFLGLSLLAQTTKTLQHDGLTRQYKEYVPSSYTGSQGVPLVICLHGLGDNMTNFSGIGMHLLADSAQFITLYPQAVSSPFGTAWNSGAGYYGIVLNDNVDDVGFISALIDSTAAIYNIDPAKVYVCGFSMGGFMSNRIASQLQQKVAATASVAGTFGQYLTPNPYRPIPVAHFHGTADSTVNYTGNMYGNDAEELVNWWVDFNNCDTPAVMTALPDIASDGYTVERYDYNNGDQGSMVRFYKVYNAPHTWLVPGVNDISYTVEIWNFFKMFQHTSLSIEESTDASISVFPNPATDIIQVNCFNMNEGGEYEILDIRGKVFAKGGFGSGYFKVDVSGFPGGIYILNVFDDANHSTTRFIVE